MGLEVGGYNEEPDWPKMGPSMLVATCLILAIRTAKWPARVHKTSSDTDLESEIEYAHKLASRVFSTLITKTLGYVSSQAKTLVSAGRRGQSEMRPTDKEIAEKRYTAKQFLDTIGE